MLIGALRPTDGSRSSFATPVSIGTGATLKPESDAFLYLRVNDHPAKLNDNRGNIKVRIERDQ